MPGYFREQNDPETNALIREDFMRALVNLPDWAIQRACDKWVATMTRMPSPAEIVILVNRELEPIAEEITKRKREAEAQQAEVLTPEQLEQRRRTAEIAMQAAGFTQARTDAFKAARMATTFQEAEQRATKPVKRHWSDGLAEDDPRMVALRQARLEIIKVR